MADDPALPFAARYGPWALVLGASHGIGASFARELAGPNRNDLIVVSFQQPAVDRFHETAPRVGVAPGVTLVSGPMSEAEFEAAHKMTPLQRSSTPEDIARAVRFLIESPAITGTTLLVDGGQHLAAQPRDVLYLAQNS